MDNVTILKDIYQIVRTLFDIELSDKEISNLFEFRDFNDHIKYNEKENSISIALVFGGNTFLGIITPIGRFEYKLALIYKKEFINSLIERSKNLFEAIEFLNPNNNFYSFSWYDPKIFTLKRLPWKTKELPVFTITDQNEEEMNDKIKGLIFNDWNNYLEELNNPKPIIKKSRWERWFNRK